MPNKYNSKIELADGTVLMDLTGDTITAGRMTDGVTAHDQSGTPIIGTLYGVGSLFASDQSSNPGTILGFGTWKKIRESGFTWLEAGDFTWTELAEDTWGFGLYKPNVYVWIRTA